MKKNIAIIIPTLSGSGAERAASRISILLSKKYKVHLIVFFGDTVEYTYGGILHCLKKPTTTIKPLRNYSWLKQIKKIKTRENIDLSISFMDIANILNCFTNTGDIIVASVRNNTTHELKIASRFKRWVRGLGVRIVCSRSHAIVAVAKDVEYDLVENFKASKQKTQTIYNPCDLESLLTLAEHHYDRATELKKPNSIITMGRCSLQKGQWHLIRAMKTVVEAVPDTKLYILGEGKLRYKLESLTEELGLTQSVEFLGFIKNPHAYIKNSTLFVLSSLYEGLSNALLESMACGVACISSDCHSGARELLAPGTEIKEQLDEYELAPYGILTSVCGVGNFNATDPLTPQEKQLADAIIYLLQNDDVRNEYARKAKERSKDFSPEKIFAEWEKLFDELTAKQGLLGDINANNKRYSSCL